MSNIGKNLQETRLRKGLTLERISDGTNIATRFLAKLENDDFSDFPGEPYIIGFIRNYAEYLGLDPKTMIAAYRGEDEAQAVVKPVAPSAVPPATQPRLVSPGPADSAGPPEEKAAGDLPNEAAAENNTESSKKAKGFRFPWPAAHHFGKIGAALAILIVIAAVFWIFAGGILSKSGIGQNGKSPVEYRVEGGPFEKRLYVGDSLLVPLGEEVYKITLADVGEKVELDTPFGRQSLKLGESVVLDTNSDGTAEATLSIVDFEKRKASSGALVTVSFPALDQSTSPTGDVTIPGKAPLPVTDTAVNGVKAKTDTTVILRSGRGPYPFVVQVSFRGSCLFRYEADRKEWVEKYYSKGETATINVNSALTVWTSNAQAAKLSFPASGGKAIDLELGAPGEIAVKRISWDTVEGAWALVTSTLD